VRICSLVPAATEVLFALGLGESVVGVTHECDWPPEAEARPRVTASELQSGDLSSVEIDNAVAEAAREGKALYAIDEDVWEKIRPESSSRRSSATFAPSPQERFGDSTSR
jgi:iron complex transport system substrate-binding protein